MQPLDAAIVGDDEFERLYADVRTLVRGDIAMLPGFSVSRWGQGLVPNLPNASSEGGSRWPNPWLDGYFGACVTAAEGRRNNVADAIAAIRYDGRYLVDECVARTFKAASAAGNDALLVRCIDLAARMRLDPATVLVDNDARIVASRMIRDRITDLELSEAGAVFLFGMPASPPPEKK